MRKISINCWGQVDVEERRHYRGKAGPREQAKIHVDVRDVVCSCDVALLASQYLRGEGVDTRVFGDAVTAVDRALELALSLMVDEETAILNISIPGKHVSDDHTEMVVLSCTVSLSIVENGKLMFEFTPKEKLAIAVKYKTMGSGLYKEGSKEGCVSKQISAFFFFRNAVKWITMINADESEDILGEISEIKSQCYNNLALYHLHRHHYKLSVAAATTVLIMDNKNVKALYRRAVANTALQNYEIAIDDIEAALAIDPNNGPVKKQCDIIRRKQRAMSVKYANALKKLFS
nr:70 kDa peptidyl-prolyl isomerase-like [Procambarus clarkii]